ncbi:MAG: helix-turn-helix domain-containing protein [Verrucomicrobiae bacterium]
MITAHTIPALHKSVALLQAVADGHTGSVKDLSGALGIPMATCYRIVRTFLHYHWLREDGRGGYRIAFGLAHLARSYAGFELCLSLLENPLRELAGSLGLSAKITVREGHQAVTALRAEPPAPNVITSTVGAGFSLAIGSAAAVLLAGLPDDEIERVLKTAPQECWQRQAPADVWRRVKDARREGVCRELGQFHPSIYAISAPVHLSKTEIVALTFVGWPDDFEGAKLAALEKALRSASKRFHDILGTRTILAASTKQHSHATEKSL